MPARFHIDAALAPQLEFDLPDGAARHAQVLRLQPGHAITLFDGRGGEFAAQVLAMGRSSVRVRVGAHHAADPELALQVTLALGMPANERMDTLVEKATELGVSVIQPLHCQRSVLRLSAERAAKKVAHWQAVAQSAAEQSGRTRVPLIAPVQELGAWLDGLPVPKALPGGGISDADAPARVVLSLANAPALCEHAPACAGRAGNGAATRRWISLSGPEGGLTEDEEALAQRHGFAPVSLGPRVLRADTAPLALLAQLAFATERPKQGHE